MMGIPFSARFIVILHIIKGLSLVTQTQTRVRSATCPTQLPSPTLHVIFEQEIRDSSKIKAVTFLFVLIYIINVDQITHSSMPLTQHGRDLFCAFLHTKEGLKSGRDTAVLIHHLLSHTYVLVGITSYLRGQN